MLKDKEIYNIVDRLNLPNDFTHSKIKEFFEVYCELRNLNFLDFERYNKREKIINIIKMQDSSNQIKILKEILKKYNSDDLIFFDNDSKFINFEFYISDLIRRLENENQLQNPNLSDFSESVKRALDDFNLLSNTNGAANGIDRIHTALHGYLNHLCELNNITIQKKLPSITDLFKELRNKLEINCTRNSDIHRILNSIANILDSLNPIRNQNSNAHPNEKILEKEEAELIINLIKTLLNYFNSKFKNISK